MGDTYRHSDQEDEFLKFPSISKEEEEGSMSLSRDHGMLFTPPSPDPDLPSLHGVGGGGGGNDGGGDSLLDNLWSSRDDHWQQGSSAAAAAGESKDASRVVSLPGFVTPAAVDVTTATVGTAVLDTQNRTSDSLGVLRGMMTNFNSDAAMNQSMTNGIPGFNDNDNIDENSPTTPSCGIDPNRRGQQPPPSSPPPPLQLQLPPLQEEGRVTTYDSDSAFNKQMFAIQTAPSEEQEEQDDDDHDYNHKMPAAVVEKQPQQPPSSIHDSTRSSTCGSFNDDGGSVSGSSSCSCFGMTTKAFLRGEKLHGTTAPTDNTFASKQKQQDKQGSSQPQQQRTSSNNINNNINHGYDVIVRGNRLEDDLCSLWRQHHATPSLPAIPEGDGFGQEVAIGIGGGRDSAVQPSNNSNNNNNNNDNNDKPKPKKKTKQTKSKSGGLGSCGSGGVNTTVAFARTNKKNKKATGGIRRTRPKRQGISSATTAQREEDKADLEHPITKLLDTDALFGRGSGINDRLGNENLHSLCKQFGEAYRECRGKGSSARKRQIVTKVIHRFRNCLRGRAVIKVNKRYYLVKEKELITRIQNAMTTRNRGGDNDNDAAPPPPTASNETGNGGNDDNDGSNKDNDDNGGSNNTANGQ